MPGSGGSMKDVPRKTCHKRLRKQTMLFTIWFDYSGKGKRPSGYETLRWGSASYKYLMCFFTSTYFLFSNHV